MNYLEITVSNDKLNQSMMSIEESSDKQSYFKSKATGRIVKEINEKTLNRVDKKQMMSV